MHRWFIVFAFLLGCGPEESSSPGTEDAVCGENAYISDEGICRCSANHQWCDEPGGEANCCPIPQLCGNGICNVGETAATCYVDCGGLSRCGDGECDVDEDETSCFVDCATLSGPVCGDGTCDSPETGRNCPDDCVTSACTTVGCVADRCRMRCDNLAYCGASSGEVARCFGYCPGWVESLNDWFHPFRDRAPCIEALGEAFTCQAYGECADLNASWLCFVEVRDVEETCVWVPQRVTVSVSTVMLGPHGPDGCQWDAEGCMRVSDEILEELDDLIARAGAIREHATDSSQRSEIRAVYNDMKDLVYEEITALTDPPEIRGSVTVEHGPATTQTRTFEATGSTYGVVVEGVSFTDIDFDSRVTLTLRLFEEDETASVALRPIVLDRDDLLWAWANGWTSSVLVADGPEDSVLLVGVLVR